MKYNFLAGGAFLAVGLAMFVFAGAQHVSANGIVVSQVLRITGDWGALKGQRGAELFVNLPVHDAPANTYNKANVPFSYRIKWAVCDNRTSYARVTARYDLAGGLHSTINGNGAQWKQFYDEVYGERHCGSLYCFTSREYTASGINMSDVNGDHTTLQVIAQWAWSGGVPNLSYDDPHVSVTNIWLHWSTPTPTPTPTVTPTATPTPTPTPTATPTPMPSPSPSVTPSPTPSPSVTPSPTPTPTPSVTPEPTPSPTPIIRVACLDKNNVVIIVAENATQNCNVNSNTQTLSLNINNSSNNSANNSSNNSSTNNNSSNNSSENKSESKSTGGSNTNNVTVASTVPTGTVAGITTGKVLGIKTVYVPQVAGITSVPVTAKTGYEGLATILLSTVSGGSGLAYVIRKALIG